MRMPVIQSAKTRRILGILLPFVVMPACVAIFASSSRFYSLNTLLITIMSLVIFLCGFERRKTGTRRMILVAVMTALSVIGRFIFAALPAFKPITAITVITAVYLGGEAGFLTGSLSAVMSNFYFGQGPWTPFQMLAWGLIGLIAGLLSKPMKKSRIVLSAYGLFSGVIYSIVMDIWNILWYNGSFNPALYQAALATSLPFTIAYAISNIIFLNIVSQPFGEKLERVRVKYGC